MPSSSRLSDANGAIRVGVQTLTIRISLDEPAR
jgi:hypothetical protein